VADLILYDGVCGLCNGLVQFVLPRDPGHAFDFAALQSAAGRTLVRRLGRSPDDLDSFYVVTGYRSASPVLLERSSAAFFVARKLGLPWAVFSMFGVLPRALTDAVYNLVARYRYRIFGRRDTCAIPAPEHRSRFIDA
jgi:predicted DCC family thiol-disulfide oxidoreductase YuxK